MYSCRLMLKIRMQEEKHVELLKAGKQAKHRLEELAPDIRLKGKGNYWISFSFYSSVSIVCFFYMHKATLLKIFYDRLNDALHLSHRKKTTTKYY